MLQVNLAASPRVWGRASNKCLLVRLAAGFWDQGQELGIGFPLGCTNYRVLELEPRTLGPSGLVSISGGKAHPGRACSLQMSGSLP